MLLLELVQKVFILDVKVQEIMLLGRQAQKLLDDLSPLSLVLEHTLGEDIQSVLNSIRRENQCWIHGITSSVVSGHVTGAGSLAVENHVLNDSFVFEKTNG